MPWWKAKNSSFKKGSISSTGLKCSRTRDFRAMFQTSPRTLKKRKSLLPHQKKAMSPNSQLSIKGNTTREIMTQNRNQGKNDTKMRSNKRGRQKTTTQHQISTMHPRRVFDCQVISKRCWQIYWSRMEIRLMKLWSVDFKSTLVLTWNWLPQTSTYDLREPIYLYIFSRLAIESE